jgi:phage FluMu protein Com
MGTIVCAWCGKILRECDVDGISHGMCPECFEKMKADIEIYHEQRKKEEQKKK